MNVPANRYFNKNVVLCMREAHSWIRRRAYDLWLNGRPKNQDNEIAFSYTGHHDDDIEPSNKWAFDKARKEYDKANPGVIDWIISQGLGI